MIDWLILGGFAIACALLCWLEFRWTGEIAQAEHLRLQDSLTRRLTQTASDLDNSIRVNVQALLPEANQLEGRDAADVQRQLFAAWRSRDDYRRWFSRVAVVIPREDSFEYRQMDLQNGQLTTANWPAEWADFRDSLLDGAGKGRGIPRLDPASNRLEFPVFGPGREERQWLLFDLDEREIAAFLEEALGPDPEFRFELRAGGPDGRLVYPTGLPPMGKAEAMRPVLNLDELVRRRGPGGPPRDGPFHEGRGRKPGKGGKKDGKKDRGRFGGETSSGKPPGRWVLLATASSGPIATLVAQHRWFNFGVAALLAIVLFGSALALLRYTRRAQQVAAMQFDFLTGVTHELRTPLTVIRTAAHNLERDLIVDRDKIRKYATLIRENGEHLTSMVEQILEYARRREQKSR